MPFFEDQMNRIRVWSLIPKIEQNYIFWHHMYFIFTCLATAVIFYCSSTPKWSISFTDSLFLCVSGMTEAGLNTINLSQINTLQQCILMFNIIIGSSIFVSIFTVWTRRGYFEKHLKGIVHMQRDFRSRTRSRRRSLSVTGHELPVIDKLQNEQKPSDSANGYKLEPGPSVSKDPTTDAECNDLLPTLDQKLNSVDENHIEEHVTFQDTTRDPDRISVLRLAPSPPPSREHRRVLSFVGVGAHSNSTSYSLPQLNGIVRRSEKSGDNKETGELDNEAFPSYLNRTTTGRNGQVHGLTRAEREHLGGVEYRAICLLSWIVPIYFVLWQLLGCIGLAAYTAYHKSSVSRENGINPWWLGIFNGASAFNNSGMSLLDANMIPFRTSPYTMLTAGTMILAGNTAYPLFLRLFFWTSLKVLTKLYSSETVYSELKGTIRFILLYPRRVYTHLFPSTPTWWLFLTVVFLNSFDWAAFEILNINNPATDEIPHRYRVLDGLFQAIAVRHGGFYIIPIPSLRISLQVLYIVMMYINVYPITIAMRHSNVYEERSLGIYADDESIPANSEERKSLWSRSSARFIRQQVRGQLFHDLWMLGAAIWFITIAETSNFDNDPVTYSVFNIAFEVVSGYGCVGLSTGLPGPAYSFSGGWHTISKLILCLVMLRGRHRGLPVALDKAVELPRAEVALGAGEEEDHRFRRSRSILRLDHPTSERDD